MVALDAAKRQGALARARLERGAGAARGRRRAGAGAQHRQPRLRLRRRRRQAPLGLPARAVVADRARAGRRGDRAAIWPSPASPAASWSRSRCQNGAAALGGDRGACPRAPPSSSASPTWSGDPVVQGARCAPPPTRARVACYDAASGRQLWARELSALTGVGAGRALRLRQPTSAARCTRSTAATAQSSGSRTSSRTGSSRCRSPSGATVVVGDFEGYVHFLARDIGRVRRAPRHRRRRGARRAAARCRQGLLVQTEDGGLYALAP